MHVVQPKPTRLKAELVELFLQPGIFEIGSNHLRARCQRCLDPWLGLQALGSGITGEKTGRNQNARIGRVGAGGDGGNGDIAVAEIVVLAFDGIAGVELRGLLVLVLQQFMEAGCNALKRDTAFRTLRSGHGRHNRSKIQLQRVREHRIGRVRLAPHALCFRIGFDEGQAVFIAARHMHVVDSLAVDREEAACCAVFRAHIADGGTVGQGHAFQARSEEFDELADHTLLAQHLHHGEDKIGCRHAFLDLTGQAEPDDFGQEHGYWLAEHGSLGLDTANAPAEHAEAVDHGCVRVGANARIRIGDGYTVFFLGPYSLRQIFEVHLVAYACAGRNDAEVLECLLAPFQEAVTFAVALILEIDIALEGLGIAEFVDDHRMVDDKINRDERIDLLGIATEIDHGVAHGCKIHDCWNTGKVLHQNARRTIGDFCAGTAAVDKPFGDILDILLEDRAVVFKTKQIFEQDFHGERKFGDAFQAVFFGFGQTVIDIFLIPHGEGFTAFETVNLRHFSFVLMLRPNPGRTPLPRFKDALRCGCSHFRCPSRNRSKNGTRIEIGQKWFPHRPLAWLPAI